MLSDHDIAKFKDVVRRELREELTSGDAAVTSPFLGEKVKSIFNKSRSADAAIFTTDDKPDDYTVPYDCILRLIVALDTAAVLSYILTRDTTRVKINLNGGSTLTASAAYSFDIPLKLDDAVNFQVDTTCTVLQMDVFKIRQAAP